MHDDVPVALGLAAPLLRVVYLVSVEGQSGEAEEADRRLFKDACVFACEADLLGLILLFFSVWPPLRTVLAWGR